MEEQLKNKIASLFDFIHNDLEYDSSLYYAYRGNDKERHFKTKMDVSIDEDRALLGRLERRIKKCFDSFEAPQFASYYEEDDKDGHWYVWEIHFPKGPDRKVLVLRFLKIGDELLLADID